MSETPGQRQAEHATREVLGKELTDVQHGFGQLWEKTYEISLAGASVGPRDVIRVWKAQFPAFWPPGNKFYRAAAEPSGQDGPLSTHEPPSTSTPLEEGDVAEIGVEGPAGARVWTSIAVVHTDDESFSFMTPEGHMLGGTITFRALEREGVTHAQVHALVRANDPLWELGFRLGVGHRMEDQFWHTTLQNLARYFGASGYGITQESVILDSRVQWSQAWNVRHNAALHTLLGAPVRFVRKITGRGKP